MVIPSNKVIYIQQVPVFSIKERVHRVHMQHPNVTSIFKTIYNLALSWRYCVYQRLMKC
jgi:hypothetical protein